MKKYISILTAVMLIIIILFTAKSFAQRGMGWKGSGGWGMGDAYCKMYNPGTVETISGEVVSVDKITPTKGMSYGIHMTVKTDK